jgi:hypothetical protein
MPAGGCGFRNGSQELRAWDVEAVPGRVEENVRAKLMHGEDRQKHLLPAWSKCALGLGLAAVALLIIGRQNSRQHFSAMNAFAPVAGTHHHTVQEVREERDKALATYQRALEMKEREQLSEPLAVDTPAQGTRSLGPGATYDAVSFDRDTAAQWI